ncbi:MAG: SIMPL domain-containing protein [Chloroflexi bacterium]|nr:SIMPL domain-containing protein [Chloroflexota bacterium]
MKLKLMIGSALLGVALLLSAACNGAEESKTPAPGSTLDAASRLQAGDLAKLVEDGIRLRNVGQQEGLWVNGLGKVTVAPDLALLSLGVEAQAETVENASSQAAAAMNKIFSALKNRGLADKDIRTSGFSIQPIYSTVRRPADPARFPGETIDETRIVGYRVSNQVSAKVRALDRVGVIIDDAAAAGGDLTRVQGISFTVEDTTPYEKQARDKAMQNAKDKAEQIATQAGVILGKPTLIQESGGFAPPVPLRAAAPSFDGKAEQTPISPGELEISVSVQVTYSIK